MTSQRWEPAKRSCPVCGGERLQAFRAQAHDGPPGSQVSIVECALCHFAWQYPLGRSPDASVAHFEQSYQPPDHAPDGYFDDAFRQNTAALQVDFLRDLGLARGSLLDVGGGSGAFALAAAASGLDVTAVDPALNLQALNGSKVRAVRGFASDLPAHATFDVITLWDVIEHVPDPLSVVRELRGRMAPGGWLVLETGNYKSGGRLLGGRTHWIYQLDHRWYFSPESLGFLLSEVGLSIGASADRVLRPGWHGHAAFRAPGIKSLAGQLARAPTRALEHCKRHAALLQAERWPHAGLEIFCLAARLH